MQVDLLTAKIRLSELIKSAQDGEEVIIANRGTPAVRLVPVPSHSTSGLAADHYGSTRKLLDWLQRHPLPDHARRSAAELDAQIAEMRAT